MSIDFEIDEIVRILSSYYRDGGASLVEEYGDEAPGLSKEMGNMLEAFLNEQTPYGAMYWEFKANPVANEAELMNVLEVLEEAVPEISMRLQGYMAAFYELEQPGVRDLYETSEPEEIISTPEVEATESGDEVENEDEFRDDNEYLNGNIEDHSTSAMYYEGLDTSVEPNQTDEE